jgi:phospholipid/cholesterol/gamma-HCH transport system substrate-binding protein
MQSSKLNYAAVGSFVLLGIAGLVISVSLLAGRTGSTETYVTSYDNVMGLKYGTQILYEGFPLGQIEQIKPAADPAGPRFDVVMALKSGWRIPEDSVANVAASGLLAAVAIDIRAGSSKSFIKPGGRIKGASGANVMSAMSELAAQMGDLTQNELKPLVANINRYVGIFGDSLGETTPQMLDNLLKLSERLGKASEKVLSDGNIDRMDKSVANLDRMAANMSVLSGDLAATKKQVDDLVSALNATVKDSKGDVAASLKDLNHTLSVVSRHIDTLTYNLDGTSHNMLEFSRHIRENPGLLLGGKPPRDEAAK